MEAHPTTPLQLRCISRWMPRESINGWAHLSCVIALLSVSGCGLIQVNHPETNFAADYAFEVHMAGHDVGDPVQDAGFAGPQPLDRLIEHAQQNHPSIHAAVSRLNAAQQRMRGSSEFRDPRLSVNAGVEPIQTAAGPQRASISVSQEVPRLAKLQTRDSKAQAEVDAAAAALEVEEERVSELVRKAYADLYQAQEIDRLLETQLELLKRLATITESQYRTGQITQQDWKDSLIAVDEMANRRIDQAAKINSSRRRLCMQIGLNPLVQIETLDSLPMIELAGDADLYMSIATEGNPEIALSLAQMRIRQIDVELSALEGRPDPTLSATWFGVDDGGISPVANGRDSIVLGVSVDLPVFRNQLDAATQSAAALANAEVHDHRSLKLTQQANVLALHESVAGHIAQLQKLDSQIIPSAEDIFNSSLQEFQVNRVTYERLTDYWQRVYTLREQRIKIETALFRDFALLTRWLGGQIPVKPAEPAANGLEAQPTSQPGGFVPTQPMHSGFDAGPASFERNALPLDSTRRAMQSPQ